MFVVGEVRDFATGVMVCDAPYYNAPAGVARMQTEQRIWDGEKWAPLTFATIATEELSEYYDKLRSVPRVPIT